MSRYYREHPEEEIEPHVETREFSPEQQRIIQSIIADAQVEEGEECNHSFNDGRSAYREVMQGTAQSCVICGHLVGNWETT